MQNDAKHFQPSGINTFKSLKTMLCKSPFARLGTLILLFSIFQNCWSTQFALLVQLFFKREFPLHWHLINIAVGWNAVGNNASLHSLRFWKFFHSSPKCFVIQIIVSISSMTLVRVWGVLDSSMVKAQCRQSDASQNCT